MTRNWGIVSGVPCHFCGGWNECCTNRVPDMEMSNRVLYQLALAWEEWHLVVESLEKLYELTDNDEYLILAEYIRDTLKVSGVIV
jgi:hypothetical protein